MLDNLTWTCHVCGRKRPDDKISVYSTWIAPHGVDIKQNVRYCNDRPECIEGAKKIRWIKDEG